ncbi:MAG: FAD:protein FMN transferase [Candidatus Nanopelagicales bacterium]
MTRIHNESVWTTVVTIQIEDEISDVHWQSLVNESIKFLHDVDTVFSPFRSDSYLNRVSRQDEVRVIEVNPSEHFKHYIPLVNEGFTIEAAKAFEIVESLCVAAQWKTNGAFNAWRNEIYDPIGLVKGWAADYVVEILRSYDIKQAFVNAGGDIASITDNEPWRIAIENPGDSETAIGFLDLTSGALCTSGNYQKGNHIVTRNNQNDFSSATVSGPSAALADAYATAIISDGHASFEWIEALGNDWGVIAISEDDSYIYTHNWNFDQNQFTQ